MHTNKIADLKKILPAPENPLDFNESMLARNAGILRINFPVDFVEFGKVYGSGEIRTPYSWEVWSPFRSTYPLIVLEFARIWNIYREATEIDDVPFGIFPEVGGVLPFAKTADGDWVCWRTKGEPDEWDVVDFGEYRNDGYEMLDLNFSEYFVSVLTRKIVLERHRNGDRWNPEDVVFEQSVYTDMCY